MDTWAGWYSKSVSTLVPRAQKCIWPKGTCLALVGVRRGGKTYTGIELSRKVSGILYFNFEDNIFLTDNRADNLDEILSVYNEHRSGEPELVILDEIQNIVGWEKWVRKAVDIGAFRLIVTGSSSRLLSSEISTAIGGRAVEQRVWPLSFREYLSFSKSAPNGANAHLGKLMEYLTWGGFPQVVLSESMEEKRRLLEQYLSDAILKDIINRHQIRTKRTLDQLVLFYFTNLACLHSYSSIKKGFGINTETSSDYTSFLSDAYLVFEVNRFHPNLKVQARDPKKIYVIDTGLRNVHAASPNDDIGKLAENVAFIELLRRGKKVSYFKGDREVDFIVTESGKPKQPIQVCYSDLKDTSTLRRETEALVECMGALKLKQGILLTMNREETLTIEKFKIKLKPLYRWLLEEWAPPSTEW